MVETYQENQLIDIFSKFLPANLSCSSNSNIWNNSNWSVCISNDEMASDFDLYNLITINCWHMLSKLRFLFYLVWPTETMFSSLDQVPRYVTEVSNCE